MDEDLSIVPTHGPAGQNEPVDTARMEIAALYAGRVIVDVFHVPPLFTQNLVAQVDAHDKK